ncbi:unnamed protein product [Fusarium graminearum]|uniref:Chromosome 1, complete genome n=1 Tax=Gibberella zeae (strain ATCC MYA-4620 / CBS 123657 / FGSC 9075 / NRRL 31084 / PH-1) TaxID=229533 RepID=A0A098D8I2_GIBZE|nr:unnamed protein product [Fusarium graminearum]CZS78534.1 unnamed protein product [Fusarium graminearum]
MYCRCYGTGIVSRTISDSPAITSHGRRLQNTRIHNKPLHMVTREVSSKDKRPPAPIMMPLSSGFSYGYLCEKLIQVLVVPKVPFDQLSPWV